MTLPKSKPLHQPCRKRFGGRSGLWRITKLATSTKIEKKHKAPCLQVNPLFCKTPVCISGFISRPFHCQIVRAIFVVKVSCQVVAFYILKPWSGKGLNKKSLPSSRMKFFICLTSPRCKSISLCGSGKFRNSNTYLSLKVFVRS